MEGKIFLSHFFSKNLRNLRKTKIIARLFNLILPRHLCPSSCSPHRVASSYPLVLFPSSCCLILSPRLAPLSYPFILFPHLAPSYFPLVLSPHLVSSSCPFIFATRLALSSCPLIFIPRLVPSFCPLVLSLHLVHSSCPPLSCPHLLPLNLVPSSCPVILPPRLVHPSCHSSCLFSYLVPSSCFLVVCPHRVHLSCLFVLFPRRVCPHLVPSSCLFILSDYLFFNRILKGFFSQAIHPKRFAISAITSLLSLRHVCDVWQHTRNKPQNVFLLLQTMSIGWQKRITILPPNPEVPGSIPNLVEGWIFGWPSFPLKFTQLSIRVGKMSTSTHGPLWSGCQRRLYISTPSTRKGSHGRK